ncbi:CLUMA_CG002662, isoform A [Clunio marinus]|uniref:CLUMA_CG002662, isoform A n=1 Tax=Clunio marinus TaxID=568069 RepID=A0A1J1HR79_9DIPT|nr:CLUMA_CG002662, isoform A [Clunio marinus]
MKNKSFRILKLLLVLSISAVCTANHYDEKLTLECIKRYLKDRNVNEDLLSFVDPFYGSVTDCESAVKGRLAVYHSSLRSALFNDRTRRPFVECTMRDIEEDDDSYDDVVLRKAAIEMISNWRFWSYFSKSSRIEELDSKANRIVLKSLTKCKGHREFGELFNNIHDGGVSWDRSGEEEYCMRKHLLSKNLLNPFNFGFNPNPRNVRTEGLNCDPVVQTIIGNIYKDIKASDCRINAFIRGGYADNILKAEVLSKLYLTMSDKSRERQDFINSMVDISYDADKC